MNKEDKKEIEIEIESETDFSPYCSECGGCGIVDCCGIKEFLKKHVVGKTNCLNEESFVSSIIELVENE